MTQLITRDGFQDEYWPETGLLFDFDAYWLGQDLPEEEPLGLRIDVSQDVADIVPWFERLSLIVIPFETSADGRGFSQARQLRQLGYTGKIRAEGHVLVDQFRAALRVGIDEVAISDDQAARNPEAQWLAVSLPQSYQSRLFAAE